MIKKLNIGNNILEGGYMKSYWINSLNEKEINKYETLQENINTDICIIGGGLTGINLAYNLSKHNIKTVLIEKDRICRSTSGNSTAKITSQHGLIYKYLADSKGIDFAKNYYSANEDAIENISNIIKNENIECDFEYQPSCVFTKTFKDIQKLKDEARIVNEFGGKAQYLEAKDIDINNLIKVVAGVKFENQAQFNPYKYANALTKICSNSKIRIYEKTKAIDISNKNNNYMIKTENGCKIRTKYLVLATKYPIINMPGFYFIKMYQSTSYGIGIRTKERIFNGMYINSEKPTISLRTVKDENGYLLIIVGSDHKTGEEMDLSNSYINLEKIAKEIYPRGEIKYRWNTEDCITLDKIPYIGEFSVLWKNCYIATGFNKWGMTTSKLAADIITNKILGEKNKYEEIFTSTRLEPIKNIKEVSNMAKESIDGLVIKKLEIPKEDIDQIQNDEGKKVEINGKKVAIYKDKDGKIYEVNPICKHLGCELSWNNLDKTWDCPCHGSRYDYKGNLIYGPSVKDLD